MAGAPSSGNRVPATLFGLVFLSGASGLVFEIVWIRGLGLTLGTTTSSIATVVAAYMMGMALGSWMIGRLADRHPNPFRLYGMLELGIAGSGLALSLLLLRGQAALSALALATGIVDQPPAVQVLLRGALAFAVLLVPTTLMGGTLPALTRALVGRRTPGRAVGMLYAMNTAGAVVGALLPDSLAVPNLGLLHTTFLAGASDLGVALIALRLAPFPEFVAPPPAPPAGPRNRRALLLFGISGFCALGYELAWSRIIEHLVGGMAIGFAIVLAVYLAALALGAALGELLVDRLRNPIQWAGLTLSGSALATLLPLVAFSQGHAHLLQRYSASQGWMSHRLQLITLGNALILEGIAALLMGAGFPFLAAAAVGPTRAGQATGELYSVNTLAGVFGSLIAGFVLLPHLGLERTIGACCALAAAGAVAGTVGSGAGWRFIPTATVSLLVLILVIMPSPGRLTQALLGLTEPPLALVEGATTSAAAVSATKMGVEIYRTLAEPGVSMSDTSFTARRYMGLMGHLPLLFAGGGPRDALLICFGVGNTARSLLSHPEVRRLDIVDLSPEVLQLSPVFAEITGSDPLRDSRTAVTVEDGRFFLENSGRTYDVITAEPPPPTFAGVGNLYSREYYAAARRALRPGGVIAQWLPRFLLTPAEMLSIVAALEAEFSYVGLFYGSQQEWVLLGSQRPLAIDLPAWEQQASAPSIQADLRRIGFRGVDDLVATYMQTNEGLRTSASRAEPVTDDMPLLQYPDDDIRDPLELPPGLVGSTAEVLAMIHSPGAQRDGQLLGAIEAQRMVVAALSRRYPSPEDYELEEGTWMMAALAKAPGHPDIMKSLDVDDDQVRAARIALLRAPGDAPATWVLARRSFYDGQWGAAREYLDTLPPEKVGAARYWLLRAGCARALGRSEEAAEALAHSEDASQDPRFRSQITGLAGVSAGLAPWGLGLRITDAQGSP